MRLVCDICSHTISKTGSSGHGIHYACTFCNRNLVVSILGGNLVYKVAWGEDCDGSKLRTVKS